MATLPTYDSKRNIKATTPGPVASGAAQRASVYDPLIQTADKIKTAWYDAVDTTQANHAKSKFAVRKAEIEAKAASDPDYNNSALYFDALIKAKEDSLEGFQNKAKQAEVSAELDLQSQLSQIKINNGFQKKLIAAGQADLENYIDTKTQEAIVNPAESSNILKEINRTIDENIAKGIQDRAYGIKQKKEIKDNIRLGKYDSYIWKDPEGAKEIIKNAKDLTPKEKQNLEKSANTLNRSRKKKADFEKYKISTETALEIGKEILNDTLTPNRVDNLSREGIIGPKMAKAFMRSLYERDYSGKEGAGQGYVKMLNDVLDDESKAEDVIMRATDAYTEGTIGVDEYSYFLDYANGMFQEEVKEEPKKPNPLRWAIDAVKGIGEGLSGVGMPERQVIKKIMDKKSPEQAVKEVKEETVIMKDPSLITSEDPVQDARIKEATRVLKANGYPITNANIENLLGQADSVMLKNTDGK